MENFNSAELRAGGLAMIIGVNNPDNSHVIGRTVEVISVHKIGDDFPRHLLNSLGRQVLDQALEIGEGETACTHDACVVAAEFLSYNTEYWLEGYAFIQSVYLMPLGDNYSRAEKFAHELESTKEKETT